MGETATERRDALVERLFQATVGAFDLAGVYIGERLGLYRALAERRPLTSASSRRRPGSTSGTRANGWSRRPPARSSRPSPTATTGGSRCPEAMPRRSWTPRA